MDCRRTDRNQPLFAMPSTPPTPNEHKRTPSVSPPTNDIGAQSPTNEHIDRLAGILLTYNFFERELGYVQGMSDLCAPLYVALGTDEEMTFWCFVEVMDRMVRNFI